MDIKKQLHLPKEAIICGRKFKMIYDEQQASGFFDFEKSWIGVGTIYLEDNPEFVYQTLHHEVSEAIHCILQQRYISPSVEGEYLFCMNHHQFSAHDEILSLTMLQFFK